MSHHVLRGDGTISTCHWRDAETRLLIKIWRQPHILAEVCDPSSRQKSVYKRIAKRIAAAGYYRDENQIKNKIRTMTTNFKKLSKMNLEERSNWTGQGKQSFLYFNELREFLDVETAGDAGGSTSGHDGDSPLSPSAQQTPGVLGRASSALPPRLQVIKIEENHQQEATTIAFDRTNMSNGINDGASLLLNQRDTPDHQLHHLPDGNFDDGESHVMLDTAGTEVHVGWISDEDDIDSEEPKAKVKCNTDLRNPFSKRESRNHKKDETVRELVKILMENNMQRDKVLMEAEDAHRRMEAERHTEEIRLLRDQIQLERDRLQFEREERERMELVRREEAARAERLRREEMERTEKARLDERDREERRFTLMMALIKGAQNHGN